MVDDEHWTDLGLEQYADLAMGILPRELRSIDELNPKARQIVEAMWPTPVSQDAGSSAGQTTRSNNAHLAPTLTDAMRLWARPQSRDFRSGEVSEATAAANSRPLNEQVALWSTIRASDADKGGPHQSFGAGGTPLTAQANLWATVNAGNFNDGESPAQWRGRQARMLDKGYNGNGAGVPLSIQAQEFLTGRPDLTPPLSGDTSSSSGPTSHQLNPVFVEWLMLGITRIGWTVACMCDPALIGSARSATASCQSKPPGRSEPCGRE